MKFPKDFYWGAATASYQVEGGIENCDWAQAARDGRVPECGRSCDHYNRYEQDFDLAKQLGHNAHRFSIEWARIEPKAGEFNQREIDHYKAVIKALKIRGLKPYVTLWHFTLPQWFVDQGGFENPKAPEYFARYAGKMAAELGEELDGLTTMNEPMVFAGLGWLKGNWPPFKQFSLVTRFELTNSGSRSMSRPSVKFSHYFTYRKVVNNLIKAHRLAYEAIKSEHTHLKVSLVKHIVAYDANWNPLNKIWASVQDNFFNHSFLRRVADSCDEFGLNFYHYVKYGDRPAFEKSDMGWEMAPAGIYNALKTLWKYKKPIFVSECGLADHDDSHRAWYIEEQIKGVIKAYEEGIEVTGHMYWSLMDNYEWALGFEKKFGLIEINYQTLERKIRPSALVYKELIEKYSEIE
ncbi:glycoside hydrolase family 1 protein [Candidatus Kaiserbacteria bacterium]|nr:glycoside hydrolase family 1 protein [Candidatus Kaiserbacteria bacterium]